MIRRHRAEGTAGPRRVCRPIDRTAPADASSLKSPNKILGLIEGHPISRFCLAKAAGFADHVVSIATPGIT
jgi:hypothetical protein